MMAVSMLTTFDRYRASNFSKCFRAFLIFINVAADAEKFFKLE